ncbi:MAG: hypothetical protein ACXABY_06110 [Candidatus Thorarchaeota archaeon]|jgi:hypothetical protein
MYKVTANVEYDYGGQGDETLHIHTFLSEAEARAYILGVRDASQFEPKIKLNGKEISNVP